jgi:hypothetical protein
MNGEAGWSFGVAGNLVGGHGRGPYIDFRRFGGEMLQANASARGGGSKMRRRGDF